MHQRLTRRAFIVRSVALTAGAAGVALAGPSLSLAQAPVNDQDLEDKGDAFRRGQMRGAAAVSTSDGPAVQATENRGDFTSAALQSTDRFTHVGLHWAAAVPKNADLSFQVRTSADGADWSPWRAVPVESQPDETPVGDYFGSLVYAGGARFVQYRATFRTAGGASPTLRRVTATVIDSPATASTTQPTTVSDADSGQVLSVTTREQWGADDTYRFTRSKSEIWPEMFVPAKKLVVHHTATRNDYASSADAAAEVRAIYRYHAVTKRWGDIGYNALVDKFGNVYEGRHGRGGDRGDTLSPREILSAGVVAGHDYHHNYGSAGVALLGDATQSGWPMPNASGAMWDGLVRYCTFEAGRQFLRPLKAGVTSQTSDADIAASAFLRSDDLWTDNMRNVSGHQETEATLCPGQVMGLLDELRTAIHGNITQSRAGGVSVSAAGREVTLSTGLSLSFSWSPEDLPSGWTVVGYEYCFEGWSKPSTSDNIQYLSGYNSTSAAAQPRPAWTRVAKDTVQQSFGVGQPGHYTLHVRAWVQKGTNSEVRAAYEGSYTCLVKPSGSTGGKSSKP